MKIVWNNFICFMKNAINILIMEKLFRCLCSSLLLFVCNVIFLITLDVLLDQTLLLKILKILLFNILRAKIIQWLLPPSVRRGKESDTYWLKTNLYNLNMASNITWHNPVSISQTPDSPKGCPLTAPLDYYQVFHLYIGHHIPQKKNYL